MSPRKGEADASRGAGRFVLFVLALVVGLPLLIASGVTAVGPPSGETIVFIVAVLAFVAGGLSAPWSPRGVVAARVAVFLALGVVGWRMLSAGDGTTIRHHRGPGRDDGRWTDRLVPERDLAMGGTVILEASGALAGQPSLLPSLRDGYDRMALSEGPVPSAVLGTVLFGQSRDDHTFLRLAPPARFHPPEAVAVFLHGSMGNVTLLCWQVAQAATPVGLDVVCPSTDMAGAWAEPEGRAILAATIERLRSQRVERIYLVGLSAGAAGLSRLAPDLDLEADGVGGVALLSGAAEGAQPVPGLPTLVLTGELDHGQTERARAYAERGEPADVSYVELEGAAHWMLLSHYPEATRELRHWLAVQEGFGDIHD